MRSDQRRIDQIKIKWQPPYFNGYAQAGGGACARGGERERLSRRLDATAVQNALRLKVLAPSDAPDGVGVEAAEGVDQGAKDQGEEGPHGQLGQQLGPGVGAEAGAGVGIGWGRGTGRLGVGQRGDVSRAVKMGGRGS
jgi:hypothetical protein